MIWQSQKLSVHAQLHLHSLSSDKFQVALDSHTTGIYNTNETDSFQKQWHFEKKQI